MLTQFQETAEHSSGWSLLLRGDFVVYVLTLPCVICFHFGVKVRMGRNWQEVDLHNA